MNSIELSSSMFQSPYHRVEKVRQKALVPSSFLGFDTDREVLADARQPTILGRLVTALQLLSIEAVEQKATSQRQTSTCCWTPTTGCIDRMDCREKVQYNQQDLC